MPPCPVRAHRISPTRELPTPRAVTVSIYRKVDAKNVFARVMIMCTRDECRVMHDNSTVTGA